MEFISQNNSLGLPGGLEDNKRDEQISSNSKLTYLDILR